MKFSFAGSSTLVQQLTNGAKADVFASADQTNMDKAVQGGVIDGLAAPFATNKLAIGVDSDQNDEAPGHVLTSMVKGVNTATFDAIRRVQNHTFKGGIYSFGLKEGGVGYIYDNRNRALFPDSARARVEELKQEIIAGRITVPSTR